MKKFITPKDYPHDKCLNTKRAICKKSIRGFVSGIIVDKNIYTILILGENILWEYSCEKQRDQVFDMMLKDLQDLQGEQQPKTPNSFNDDNIKKDDLKCCGNCYNASVFDSETPGTLKCGDDLVNAFWVCAKWEFDYQDKNDRIKLQLNGNN